MVSYGRRGGRQEQSNGADGDQGELGLGRREKVTPVLCVGTKLFEPQFSDEVRSGGGGASAARVRTGRLLCSALRRGAAWSSNAVATRAYAHVTLQKVGDLIVCR